MIDKTKDERTKEEKQSVLKDAKVRNIIFNSLDSVLTNYVLSCKTAKKMWEKIKVHCGQTYQEKYKISFHSRVRVL